MAHAYPLHRYPLHRPASAECLCCHLAHEFTFKSRSDHVVCGECAKHAGDHRAKVGDTEHIKMWQAAYSYAESQDAQAMAAKAEEIVREKSTQQELRARIADLEGALKAGLDARPVELLTRWYEQTKIAEAEEKTAKAGRLITHLYGVVLQVDEAHHRDDDNDDNCSCGTPTSACAVYQALDGVRDRLYKWEKEEVPKARAGQPHSLPRWHPDSQSTRDRYFR